MTHSFARGFKVSHSINAGVGGYADRRTVAKMPMPTAPLKSGVGGPILGRRGRENAPPQRGVGQADCGCDAAYVARGQHMQTCGATAPGNAMTLMTTIDDSTEASGTAALTVQVTGCAMFCPTAFFLLGDANAWRVDSIMYNGTNFVPNGQPTLGQAFDVDNQQVSGRINGCCVPAALTITVNLTNISGTTANAIQGEFVGSCK